MHVEVAKSDHSRCSVDRATQGLQNLLAVLLVLVGGGCATLSPAQHERAATIAVDARSDADDCGRADRCALTSPLMPLAEQVRAGSTPQAPRHYALILDRGPDALLARIHLIRSARRTIDVQTYIYDEDDAGLLVLDELLAAARRGVKVRLLIDQLAALREVETLARLAGSHQNFELRLYNPTRNRGRSRWRDYVVAVSRDFTRFNQRLHSKLLLVDGALAITGGRNYQNDYYDWDPAFNFRDRELLLVGPEAQVMQAHVDAFWVAPWTVPAERLDDVGRHLLRHGVPAPAAPAYALPERAAALQQDATDPARVQATLVAPALPVGAVQFIADGPDKHTVPAGTRPDAWAGLHAELVGAQDRVLLQTPYLVLPPNLHALFATLQQRRQPPQVEVLTNSLAATDIWPAYALTYRHRQRLMHDLRFQLYEYKPFPADAPFDLASTGAQMPTSTLALNFAASPPSPRAAGVKIGLHAKALVIDDRLGVVGSHNFDHRGERFNIESAVLIEDPGFAAALTASIRRDMAPDNAWRVSAAATSRPAAALGGWLSRVPLLDLWPFRYGSSYEFRPGPQCPQPPPAAHPDFARCHARVGDFPDTGFVIRGLTRVLTSVGAGLAPLL